MPRPKLPRPTAAQNELSVIRHKSSEVQKVTESIVVFANCMPPSEITVRQRPIV